MEGEAQKLIHVCLIVITSLCYCYLISAKIPKGNFRLISLFPIFIIFTILPLHVSTAFFTAVTTLFFSWLANFKLILFAFDHGPLSLPNSRKSLPLFIAKAAFPMRMKQKSDNPIPPKKLPMNLGTEILLSIILIAPIKKYGEDLHPKILLVIYCCMIFLLMEMVLVLTSIIVRVFTGSELEPPSNEPYLSTSLQDFWGRRWNLTATNSLRHTIYNPVRSVTTRFLGKDWARLLAVMATFLVSGLMHELLFAYVARASPSWEMTGYFLVQGVGVVAEIGVKKWVNGRWRLPWFVSGPLTVGFVVVSSFWLFFPPVMRNGSDKALIEDFRAFLQLVKVKLVSIIA